MQLSSVLHQCVACALSLATLAVHAAPPGSREDDPALIGIDSQFIEDPRVRLLPDNPGFTAAFVGMRVNDMMRNLRTNVVTPVPSPATPGAQPGAAVQNICSPTATSGTKEINVNCVVVGSSFGNK